MGEQPISKADRQKAHDFITRIYNDDDTLHWAPTNDPDPATSKPLPQGGETNSPLVVATISNISPGVIAAYNEIIREHRQLLGEDTAIPRNHAATEDGVNWSMTVTMDSLFQTQLARALLQEEHRPARGGGGRGM